MEEKLTELQRAEIKKAFSICDKDGNGSIDVNELKTVMTAILDQEPTENELKDLMKTIDTDNSGTVEYSEFLEAMTNWFKRDYTASGKMNLAIGKRKRHSPEKERREVHKKIRSFFAQFKQGAEFDQIRSEVERKSLRELAAGDEVMRMSSASIDFTSTQKIRFLAECKKTIEMFDALVARLNSDSQHMQIEALTNIAKLLSIVEVFPTPQARRGVAEMIIKIFELVVQTSITPRLVHLLQYTNSAQTQELVLRIFTYLAPGPRIASTPEDSLLHPNQMFFKKLVVSENAVPLLIKLITATAVPEVRLQAVMVIGWIVAHNPEVRDFVLRNNVVPPLCTLVHPQAPVELLKTVSWVLSLLCGVTHPRTRLPAWESISPMLPFLGNLLFVDDSDILDNVCSALALVLPGVPEPSVCKRLVELLGHADTRVQRGVLQTIIQVMRFDEKQTHFLLEAKLVTVLKKLLKSDNDLVRVDVCEAFIVLAGVRKKTQAIINEKIIPKLLKLIMNDEVARFKVAKVIKYVARGSPVQIDYLVKEGTVNLLIKGLSFFKVYDQVLTQIYKFCGPSYNFEFVRDILVALDSIVNVGEMEAEEKSKLNQYALTFDMGCVDGLKTVLQLLKQTPAADLDSWRQGTHRASEPPLEDMLKSLLYKIKRVHDANKDSTVSRHISQMIAEVWNTYFQDKVVEAKILIKCYYGDEIRVLEVPRHIKFTDLIAELQQKYGKGISITYQDEEGDPITIDSQLTLDSAIEKTIKASSKTLKVRVVARQPLQTPFLTPSPSLRGSPLVTPSGSPPGSPPRLSRSGSGASSSSTSASTTPVPALFFNVATPNITITPSDLKSFSLSKEVDDFKKTGEESTP
eukprot:TRINITY_DN3982_c1_g1_i5.p1 TRINITY_DN3982_c1_g1~~TRINITY_DN3982_c1_g1_i5.p1  ORF type:complete len:859 (+),score=157.44 TRINITY_DN3982_c1_g1_i5:1017-3593(+)